MAKVALVSNGGYVKRTKIGFSWTFLFFGGWVPLIRRDLTGLFKIWLFSLCTLGIYNLVACFTYNQNYIKKLLEAGFTPQTDHDIELLRRKNIEIQRMVYTKTN